MRYLPTTDPERLLAEVRDYAARELVPEMRRVAPESDITFEQVGDVPHFEIDPAARLVRHVARCAGANDPGCYVAFGSEAGLFQRAGIPAVLCGPGHIEQAHKPDEFVSLDQVARCEEFMRRLCEASPSDA
jgi:acetylornithine deacetylase